MMHKNLKVTETLEHVYSYESTQRVYTKNTNMTRFRRFSKKVCVLVLRRKVAFRSIGRVKCSTKKLLSGPKQILLISMELKIDLQNSWRRDVGCLLVNISPSNIISNLFSLERFSQKCQACFGRCEYSTGSTNPMLQALKKALLFRWYIADKSSLFNIIQGEMFLHISNNSLFQIKS